MPETTTEKKWVTYSEKHDLPQFVFNDSKLRAALKHDPVDSDDEDNNVDPLNGLWDGDTDADSIHRLIEQACQSGAVQSPERWEILVYPRENTEGNGYVLTVWSTAGHGRSCQVVAETGELRQLGERELWEGDDEIERTVAVVDYIVYTANGAAPHLVGAEYEARKVCRHYDERRRGTLGWVLTNQLAADNGKDDQVQLEREQRFETAEEAIVEAEHLIAHFHTAFVTDNLDSDVPIELNIEKFISATQRLEQFRRAEVEEWSLFEEDQAITLKLDLDDVSF